MKKLGVRCKTLAVTEQFILSFIFDEDKQRLTSKLRNDDAPGSESARYHSELGSLSIASLFYTSTYSYGPRRQVVRPLPSPPSAAEAPAQLDHIHVLRQSPTRLLPKTNTLLHTTFRFDSQPFRNAHPQTE